MCDKFYLFLLQPTHMWRHNILGLTLNHATPLYYILSILIISTLFCIEMNQKMDVGCRVIN
jgi:hypothetical protein